MCAKHFQTFNTVFDIEKIMQSICHLDSIIEVIHFWIGQKQPIKVRQSENFEFWVFRLSLFATQFNHINESRNLKWHIHKFLCNPRFHLHTRWREWGWIFTWWLRRKTRKRKETCELHLVQRVQHPAELNRSSPDPLQRKIAPEKIKTAQQWDVEKRQW